MNVEWRHAHDPRLADGSRGREDQPSRFLGGRHCPANHREVVDTVAAVMKCPGKEDPAHGSELLQSGYSNEYVFATAPHELAECPFAAGETIPMQSGGS